jgi:hypothetical protein
MTAIAILPIGTIFVLQGGREVKENEKLNSGEWPAATGRNDTDNKSPLPLSTPPGRNG